MPRFLPPLILLLLASADSPALDRVTFATNWKAQPEHGGFYRALVDGVYAEHGLDVTIRPGGPMINNRPLLAVGRVEFLMGTNLLQAFDAVKQGVPTKIVAAIFQKDPQCLISHPGRGLDDWRSLAAAPLVMSNSGRYSYFLWMNARHGFERRNLRPYNHSLAPFLMHRDWVQQGYATAEPMRVEEETGRQPNTFLLADHGWSTYSTVIETRNDLIANNPDLVQRFVDASLIGWRRYLDGGLDSGLDGNGDDANAAANARIKQDNPAMTDRQIAFSIKQMNALGLVDSGDARTLGIGAINAERVARFHREMVEAGLDKLAAVDPADAFTTQFVNRGVASKER
ncbi:MAG: ABC transporter substrate-binding protein [Planctomycetota bacterium]